MIVDLRLGGKTVVIAGGGAQALKRAEAAMGQGCRIIVLAREARAELSAYHGQGEIELRLGELGGAGFLEELGPDIAIAATDNHELNAQILAEAGRLGCLAYSADDPENSDFANMAVIDIGGAVKAGVSTGGASPAMAASIAEKTERALRDSVGPEEVAQIRLQQEARGRAAEAIPTQAGRRAFLQEVIRDGEVKRLIKSGDLPGAQGRMMEMLGGYDG